MEMNRNNKSPLPVISLAVFILSAIGVVMFLYYQNQTLKKELLKFNQTPSPTQSAKPLATPNATPVVDSPQSNSRVKSPLTVKGKVPPGWMFEGTFPIKLLDSDRNIIVQGMAKEDVPGSWQTGQFNDFMAKLIFSTTAKFGYLVLENDNPSGDPAKQLNFEQKVFLNCTPRPACLDSTPRCLIPETEDMCPAP